jgi:GTP-binding protein
LFGDEVYGILVVLDATEEQLDFPVLYANGKDGVGGKSPEETGKDLAPLFDIIIEELPPPQYHKNEPFQMLISDLSYSDFLGSLAIGKVVNGSARFRDSLVCIGPKGDIRPLSVSRVQMPGILWFFRVSKIYTSGTPSVPGNHPKHFL